MAGKRECAALLMEFLVVDKSRIHTHATLHALAVDEASLAPDRCRARAAAATARFTRARGEGLPRRELSSERKKIIVTTSISMAMTGQVGLLSAMGILGSEPGQVEQLALAYPSLGKGRFALLCASFVAELLLSFRKTEDQPTVVWRLLEALFEDRERFFRSPGVE